VETHVLLDNGEEQKVSIAGPTTAVMTRQTYLAHFSHIPLNGSPVDDEGGASYTDLWFLAYFSFHCRTGGAFAISREKVHIVELIDNQTLGMLIGVNLLKPQRAKIVYDIRNSGKDVLWVDGLFTILEMIPNKRYVRTAKILKEDGIEPSRFVKGRGIIIGSPSSNCLGMGGGG
jgi:hypothetical protein